MTDKLLCLVVTTILAAGAPVASAATRTPTWDPVFVYEVLDGSGANSIAVADATGANRLIIVPARGGSIHRMPSWAPAGDMVVFASNLQGNGIYIVDKFGRTSPCKVTSTTSPPDEFSFVGLYPAWSPVKLPIGAPDAKYKILYVDAGTGGTSDIWMVDAECGTEAALNVTQSASESEHHPTWSPDGTHIAYSGSGALPGVSGIRVAAIDGHSGSLSDDYLVAPPVGESTRNYYWPEWSHTSNTLAVRSNDGTLDKNNELWLMFPRFGGAEPPPVTLGIYPAFHPTWSADDSHVGYVQRDASSRGQPYTLWKCTITTTAQGATSCTNRTRIISSKTGLPFDFDWRRCDRIAGNAIPDCK